MQSLSRLLSISSNVISNRCLWRPTPRTRPQNRIVTPHRRPLSRAPQASAQSEDQAASPTPPPPPATAAFGRVTAAQANFVRVRIDRLEGTDAPPPQPNLLCVVRALLKKIKQEVLVGDRVRVVGIDWTDGRGMVEEVLPRDSRMSEPPVANVNHALLVFSGAMPPLQPSAATRYLVAAEAAGLPVTVALNKADLLGEDEAVAAAARVAAWGYTAVPVSVVDERGLEELEGALRGRTTVVAGPSGAGKSSIINALRLRAAGLDGTLTAMGALPSGLELVDEDDYLSDGEESCDEEEEEDESCAAELAGVELQAVGAVSERIGRGKHTTRNVTLVEMGSGGLLVDTPGFNQPTVALPPRQLGDYFPEVRAALAEERCAFSDCQHVAEPGCVVRGDWERYELYVTLLEELRGAEEAAAKRATGKRQREGNVRLKSRGGGRTGVEAKLETKSHRRVSRRSVKQALSELAKNVDDDDSEAAVL